MTVRPKEESVSESRQWSVMLTGSVGRRHRWAHWIRQHQFTGDLEKKMENQKLDRSGQDEDTDEVEKMDMGLWDPDWRETDG